MPTWFMSRARFQYVGGFDEAKDGVTIPEDLIFFLKVIRIYIHMSPPRRNDMTVIMLAFGNGWILG
jgi:hypothetical protein